MIKKYISKYEQLPMPVKASFWFVVCNILQKGIGIITTPLFTRLLTTTEYGMYTVYQSWYSVISIFATLYLSSAVYNVGILKFRKDKNRFTTSMIGLTLFCTLIIILIYCVNCSFWESVLKMSTLLIILILVQSVGTASFGFWAKEQRYEYKYKKLVILTLLISILSPLLAIFFIMSTQRYKGEARIFAFVFINGIVGLYFIIKYIKKDNHLFDLKYWKYALSYSLPLVPHFLSQIVLSQSDRIMINNMVGQSEAGIYGLAYSISMMMSIITNAVNDTIIPYTYKKLEVKDYSAIREVANVCIFIIAIGCGMVSLLAPEVIKIFATSAYYDAIMIIPAVSASVFFMFVFTLYCNIELYYEKTKSIMYASCFAAIINIVLNLVFIKRFGYCAAGYTTLVCYIIYSMMHAKFARNIIKEKKQVSEIYNDKFIFLVSFFLIVFSIFVIFLYPYVVIRYVIFMCIIICIVFNKSRLMNIYMKLKS